MRRTFADAAYLIAAIMPGDALHEASMRLRSELADWRFVTSEPVLTEVLAHVSRLGPELRLRAVQLVYDLRAGKDTEVIRQTPELFEEGLELYRRRADKGYSLTDCMSMVICLEHGITDVLTNDRHFVQEGFTALLRG